MHQNIVSQNLFVGRRSYPDQAASQAIVGGVERIIVHILLHEVHDPGDIVALVIGAVKGHPGGGITRVKEAPGFARRCAGKEEEE